MIAQFVVFIIVLLCVVGGVGVFTRAAAPLQRFLPPKTARLRSILRENGRDGPPKRHNVAFSSEIGVRTIDKRGRIRDRVGLINDMKRPRVPRSRGDSYPVPSQPPPPTQSIPAMG